MFLKDINTQADIRLIDLEKAKHAFSAEGSMLRDLDSFNRRTHDVTTTDRLRFLLAYYGQQRVNSRVKKTWKKLIRRQRRKAHSAASGR